MFCGEEGMNCLKPEVTLVNWTPKILETIYWSYWAQHRPMPSSIDELNVSQQELEEHFRNMLKDGLANSLEFINLVWDLKNISRACQQQLTRSRIGVVFSIASLRVQRCETFATDGKYHLPNTVKDKEKYHRAMTHVENVYNALLEAGESTQDARGILPLNVQSQITMAINLKAFYGLAQKRMCIKVQGEFRDMIVKMRREIELKLPPVLLEGIAEPCMTEPIGKTCILVPENENQLKEGRLEGEQNTAKVCPLYVKLFMDGRHSCWDKVKHLPYAGKSAMEVAEEHRK